MNKKDVLKTLKINYLYTYQELVIDTMVNEANKINPTNQIIVLPTGYGKTICFTISALLTKHKTLILYPLRSLLFDQRKRLEKICKVTTIYGGQTKKERTTIFNTINDSKLILVSLESLLVKDVFNILRKLKFDFIIFDEAHTLVTWGLDFRFRVLEVCQKIQLLDYKLISLFTATCDNKVELNLCNLVLFNSKYNIIFSNIDRDNIKYFVIPTLSRFRTIKAILSNKNFLPCIIFFNERALCEKVAICIKRYISKEVYYYHSKLSNNKKIEIENKFKDSNSAILCATNAYGMGIDKANVRSIIHYSIFGNVLSYLQESGRCARDKEIGYAFILKSSFLRNDKLTNLFLKSSCIRFNLLNEMNIYIDNCSGCSFCNKTKFEVDPIVKKIIKLVLLHPLYYTSETILTCFNSTPYLNYLRKDIKLSKYEINTLEVQQIIHNLINLKVIKRKKHIPFKRCLYIGYNYNKKLKNFYSNKK